MNITLEVLLLFVSVKPHLRDFTGMLLVLTFQMLPIFWTDNIAKNMGKNAALAQNKILVLLVIPSSIFTKAGRSQQDGRVPCIIVLGVASLCILDFEAYRMLLTLYWTSVVEQLKEMDDVDMLTLVVQEMSKNFPTLWTTLVHERDL